MASVKTRSAGLDLVRALGIIAIVVGHVVTSPVVVKSTFTWHVPVFFVLTGYLWADHRPMSAEWRSRWKSLVRPYLSWLVVIGCVAIPLTSLRDGPRHAAGQLLTMVLGGSYLKTPFTAFWFFSCLLVAGLVFRGCQLLRVPWWAVAVVACALTPLGPTLAKVPLAIGVAVPAVFFVSMGRGLRSAPERFRRWPLGAALLVIGVAAVVSGLDTPLDLKVGNFGRPVIGVVTALVISTGLVFCSESMSAQIGRATPWVSSAVARFGPAVILAHGLPLDLSRSVTSSLLRLAVVAAGTAVMVWLAARSPWSERLLGPDLRAREVRATGSGPGGAPGPGDRPPGQGGRAAGL